MIEGYLALASFPTLPFIRILITSRPERHIRSVFSQQQDHARQCFMM